MNTAITTGSHMTKTVFLFLASLLTTGLFAQDSTHAREAVRNSFTLSAGASLPLGNFGDAGRGESVRGGAAKTGAALSADIAVGGATAWITSLLVSFNPSDGSALSTLSGSDVTVDPWWTIWPMTGIEWLSDVSPTVVLTICGQIGCFVGISPWTTVHGPSFTIASVASDRAPAVSVGAAAGATISDHYAAKLRYLYAKPSYDLTITDVGVTTTSHESRPTSLLVFTLGWTW